MRSDGIIELTSKITEATALDEPKPVLQDDQKPRQSSKEKAPEPEPEKSPEERMLEAVMGFEGGNHPIFRSDFTGTWRLEDDLPPDDPFTEQVNKKAMTKALSVKFDDNFWETEEIKT